MKWYIVAIIVFSGCMSSSASDNTRQTVRVSTGQFPPYLSKNLAGYGCVASMIASVFHIQGYNVEFIFLPWARAYHQAKVGNYDATAFWLDSGERRQDFLFPKNSIVEEKYYFYFLKKNRLKFNSYDELNNKTLIINRGYTYSELFWREIKDRNITLLYAKKEGQNIDMILSGRSDYTILNEKAANHYINKLPVKTRSLIGKSNSAFIVSKAYILFPKRNKSAENIVADFDLGFKKLMDNDNYVKEYKNKCSNF